MSAIHHEELPSSSYYMDHRRKPRVTATATAMTMTMNNSNANMADINYRSATDSSKEEGKPCDVKEDVDDDLDWLSLPQLQQAPPLRNDVAILSTSDTIQYEDSNMIVAVAPESNQEELPHDDFLPVAPNTPAVTAEAQSEQRLVVQIYYIDRAPIQEQDVKKQKIAADIITEEAAATAVDKKNKIKKSNNRGRVKIPFPYKLHAMLEGVQHDALCHIISWQPHGRAFLVHRPKEFTRQVSETYFKQSKYTSFQRQLNLYGFRRLTRIGPDAGAYFHEYFLRGRVYLSDLIIRTKIKGTITFTRSRSPLNPDLEPNLYAFPPVLECMHMAGNMIAHEEAHHTQEEKTRREELPAPPQSMASTFATSTATAVETAHPPPPRWGAPHEITPEGPPRQTIIGSMNVMLVAARQESSWPALPGIMHQPLAAGTFCGPILLPISEEAHFLLHQECQQCTENGLSPGTTITSTVSPLPFPVSQERLIPIPTEILTESDDCKHQFEGMTFHYLEPSFYF
jgi:hypothetical protein